MNNKKDDDIRTLLKQVVPPPLGHHLQRDLWPQMLLRLEQRRPAVPWFDWAFIALLLLGLLFSPRSIPVLLYHL